MKNRHTLVMIVMALAMSLFTGVSARAEQTVISEDLTTTCTVYSGTNENAQNYIIWSSPVKSYLESAGDRLMRVQAGISGMSDYLVEYYDRNYNLLSTKAVEQELNLFGGFYSDGSYYYILSGQNNPNEKNNREVMRITQYDTGWNRLGAASLYGANTYIPFDAGSARFAKDGKYLLIRTCHEMYKSDDGYHHQANMTIQVDTQEMQVTDCYSDIMNVNYGYVSHSFNQFIQVEDHKIVALDHGDALPRSFNLCLYKTDVSRGTFTPVYGKYCDNIDVMTFESTRGVNATGAGAGAFLISDTHYLLAGSKEKSGLGNVNRNIFVAAIDKTTREVKTRYLTDYPYDTSVSVPHMVLLESGHYLVLWQCNKKVCYQEVNAAGKKMGEIHEFEGNLSDCVPLVQDGKIIWYVWKNGQVTFYEIDEDSIDDVKISQIVNGHKYVISDEPVTDGTNRSVCSVCGDAYQYGVINYITPYWYINGTYRKEIKNIEPGQIFEMRPLTIRGGNENYPTYDKIYTIKSDDESVIRVNENQVTYPEMEAVGYGETTLTVYPTYNPAYKQTFTAYVGYKMSDAEITFSEDCFDYTGQPIEPEITLVHHDEMLTKDTDYTVTYENNVDTGTAKVIITGMGQYVGTAEAEFTIYAQDISLLDPELSQDTVVYNGQERRPAIKALFSGDYELEEGRDYELTYVGDFKSADTENYVIIEGRGGFVKSKRLDFTINKLNLADCSIRLDKSQVFSSEAEEEQPEVSVFYGEYEIPASDYQVHYGEVTDLGEVFVYISAGGGSDYNNEARNCYVIDREDDGNDETEEPYNAEIQEGNCEGDNSASYWVVQAYMDDYDLVIHQADSLWYTGYEQMPSVVVMDGEDPIDPVFYDIAYENNVDAGTATVTVTGRGRYYGTLYGEFEIQARSLEMAEASIESCIYQGSPVWPETVITVDGILLDEGKDYVLEFEDHDQAGTAYALVTGTGNYAGRAVFAFEIGKGTYDLSDISFENQALEYDEAPHTIEIDGRLPYGVDVYYTAENMETESLADLTQIEPGMYKITAHFEGDEDNYEPIPDRTAVLSILPATYDMSSVTFEDAVYVYDGERHGLEISGRLPEGVSVSYDCEGETEPGEYEITACFTGDNNHAPIAAMTARLIIDKQDYDMSGIRFDDLTVDYNGDNYGIEIRGELPEGVEVFYTLTEATLPGEYYIQVHFEGDQDYYHDIPDMGAVLTIKPSEASMHFDADEIRVSALDEDFTNPLQYNGDGTVQYQSSDPSVARVDEAGNVTIISAGKTTITACASRGTIFDECQASYQLTIDPVSISTGYTVKPGYTETAFTGSYLKPSVKVTGGGRTLVKGVDYAVSYSKNKNVGTATITVRGIGRYTGSKNASFKINPKATSITRIANLSSRKVKIKWKKISGATGYQVKYVTGKTSKHVTVKGASTITKTITNLIKGKAYKFYVRAYKAVAGKNYYSAWSAAKSTKVKI